MAHEDDELDLPDEEQEDQAEQNRQGYRLRQAERKNAELQSKIDALERAQAFQGAGIDTGDAKFRYFVEGYKGEMTAEAVKAEAIAVGLMEVEAPADPAAAAPELATQERIATAAQGGTQPVTGVQGAQQALDEAYAKGGTATLLQQMAALGLVISED